MNDLRIPVAEKFLPLLEPARDKAAKGGRASGKSHFFADLWLDESLRMKLDFLCIREIQKSLDFSVKKLLQSKIEKYNAGYYFDVIDRKITSKLGGITIFEGMQDHTSDSIKSFESFHRSWFEEAHRASQRSIELLRPTIRVPGSERWWSWNPYEATDPIEVYFDKDNPPPDSIIVEANYMDNPWLSEESRKDMEYDKKRDYEKYEHVWLGQYQAHSEARVFKNWNIEEFERPEGSIYRMGADWGYAIDPSVLIRCSIEGNRLYIDHEAYMIGCEIVNLPDLFDRVPESRKWFITADSARPETINYMRSHGYPKMNSAAKGKGSVEEGISFLQSFDIIVHPRCVHTIDELKSYCYKTDPLTGKVIPILEDKNNHVIDALRYACEGARRGIKERKVVTTRRVVYAERMSGTAGWMGA